MPAAPNVSDHATPDNEDPLLGFNFKLDVGNKMAGYFTEVSGLGSENEVIEHKVVDTEGREIIRKIPGRLKWGDVTMKRGITTSLLIWEWRDKIVLGKTNDARTNCTISLMDREHTKALAQWTLEKAWPSKVNGPSLKSDSNEFGVEEVTIVHEGLARTK